MQRWIGHEIADIDRVQTGNWRLYPMNYEKSLVNFNSYVN